MPPIGSTSYLNRDRSSNSQTNNTPAFSSKFATFMLAGVGIAIFVALIEAYNRKTAGWLVGLIILSILIQNPMIFSWIAGLFKGLNNG